MQHQLCSAPRLMPIKNQICMACQQRVKSGFKMSGWDHVFSRGAKLVQVNYQIVQFSFLLQSNIFLQCRIMGAQNSPISTPENLQRHQSTPKINKKTTLAEGWENIDHLRDFNIVRNKVDGRIGEIRKFQLNPIYDPSTEISIYHQREVANAPIVKSYGAEILEKVSRKKSKIENSRVGICMSNNNLAVVTERIPFTLRNLPQLSFQESLYVLRESLAGFQFLFSRSGPLHVNEDKIGINNLGKIKVWVNENWAQNHPSHQIPSLNSTRSHKLDRQYNLIAPQFRDQQQMTENIIDVVEDKCQFGKFPNQFGILLRENSHSLTTAKKFVSGFIKDRKFQIPQEIHQRTIKLTQRGIEDLQARERELQIERGEQAKTETFSTHKYAKNIDNNPNPVLYHMEGPSKIPQKNDYAPEDYREHANNYKNLHSFTPTFNLPMTSNHKVLQPTYSVQRGVGSQPDTKKNISFGVNNY